MFRFNVVFDAWPYLVKGLGITLVVTIASLVAGMILGLVVGLMRLSSNRAVAGVAAAYVAVLRNTPVLVQLIWVYYCLPILLGIDLDAITSCIVALSLHGGAYVGEIVRGGIQSIERGQLEAARSVGLSYSQVMRKVVLPQALRRVIPPLANEGVTLLKYSSLVSTLGVADLTYNAQVVATTTFRPLEIYTFLALEYLVLCLILSYGAFRLEVRLAKAD
jgi:His/Glu/Gln/Arg/opine family amino acid ABC transporter permease subunit